MFKKSIFSAHLKAFPAAQSVTAESKHQQRFLFCSVEQQKKRAKGSKGALTVGPVDPYRAEAQMSPLPCSPHTHYLKPKCTQARLPPTHALRSVYVSVCSFWVMLVLCAEVAKVLLVYLIVIDTGVKKTSKCRRTDSTIYSSKSKKVQSLQVIIHARRNRRSLTEWLWSRQMTYFNEFRLYNADL